MNTSEAKINRHVLVLAGHLVQGVWDGMWITCRLVNITLYPLKDITYYSYLLTRYYRKLPNITSKIKVNAAFCNRTLDNLFESSRTMYWIFYFSYQLYFISNSDCSTKLSWCITAYNCRNRKVFISITSYDCVLYVSHLSLPKFNTSLVNIWNDPVTMKWTILEYSLITLWNKGCRCILVILNNNVTI